MQRLRSLGPGNRDIAEIAAGRAIGGSGPERCLQHRPAADAAAAHDEEMPARRRQGQGYLDRLPGAGVTERHRHGRPIRRIGHVTQGLRSIRRRNHAAGNASASSPPSTDLSTPPIPTGARMPQA
jgi:hypothetical protein